MGTARWWAAGSLAAALPAEPGRGSGSGAGRDGTFEGCGRKLLYPPASFEAVK